MLGTQCENDDSIYVRMRDYVRETGVKSTVSQFARNYFIFSKIVQLHDLHHFCLQGKKIQVCNGNCSCLYAERLQKPVYKSDNWTGVITFAKGFHLIDERNGGHVYLLRGEKLIAIPPQIIKWTDFQQSMKAKKPLWSAQGTTFLEEQLREYREERRRGLRSTSASRGNGKRTTQGSDLRENGKARRNSWSEGSNHGRYKEGEKFLGQEPANILVASALEPDTPEIDSEPSILEETTPYKLPAKKRQSKDRKFIFKDEINYKLEDTRSPLEKLKEILFTLQDDFEPDFYRDVCHSCKMDISVPEIRSSGFIEFYGLTRQLMKEYKKNPLNLAYGDDKLIEEIIDRCTEGVTAQDKALSGVERPQHEVHKKALDNQKAANAKKAPTKALAELQTEDTPQRSKKDGQKWRVHYNTKSLRSVDHLKQDRKKSQAMEDELMAPMLRLKRKNMPFGRFITSSTGAGNGRSLDLLFLIDSGARFGVISHDSYLKLGLEKELTTNNCSLTGITGSKSKVTIGSVHLCLKAHDNPRMSMQTEFLVFDPSNPFQTNILGQKAFQEYQLTLSIRGPAEGRLIMGSTGLAMPLEMEADDISIMASGIVNQTSQSEHAEPSPDLQEVSKDGSKGLDLMDTIKMLPLAIQLFDTADKFQQVAESHLMNPELEVTTVTDEDEDTLDPADINSITDKRILFPSEEDTLEQKNPLSLGHLDSNLQRRIKELFNRYKNSFAKNNRDQGCFALFKCSLNFMENRISVQARRPQNFDRIENEIQDFIEGGVLELNQTGGSDMHVINFVAVRKEAGLRHTKADAWRKKRDNPGAPEAPPTHGFRLAADLSSLNTILLGPRRVSLPDAQEIIARVAGANVSKLDLFLFFFSLVLDERSRGKIGVYLKNGLATFSRLPQGLAVSSYYALLAGKLTFSSTTFNLFRERHPRYRNALRGVQSIENYLLIYVDDIYVISPKAWGDHVHLILLEYVLWAVDLVQLKLKYAKTELFCEEVVILGKYVNLKEGITILDPERRRAFMRWPPPRGTAELSSRLASLAYFSDYCPVLKIVGEPLFALLKSGRYEWNAIHTRSWENLKFVLSLNLQLAVPSRESRLALFTDASAIGLSFALMEVDESLQMRPVKLDSKLFRSAERRAPIIMRELYAILYGLSRCEYLIAQSRHRCMVFSDSKWLSFLSANKKYNARLFANAMYLLYYAPNINICYINGRFNQLADTISRAFYSVYLTSPNPQRNEMVDRITIPLDKAGLTPGATLTADELYSFLMSEVPSRLVPCQKNVPRLYQVSPQQLQNVWGGVSPESQFLYCLRATSSHDPRILNSDVLREFLLSLEKDKAPKDLLKKFRESIASHQLKNKLQDLKEAYPLTASGEERLLNKLRVPCPDLGSASCGKMPDPLRKRYGNQLELSMQKAREVRKEVNYMTSMLGLETNTKPGQMVSFQTQLPKAAISQLQQDKRVASLTTSSLQGVGISSHHADDTTQEDGSNAPQEAEIKKSRRRPPKEKWLVAEAGHTKKDDFPRKRSPRREKWIVADQSSRVKNEVLVGNNQEAEEEQPLTEGEQERASAEEERGKEKMARRPRKEVWLVAPRGNTITKERSPNGTVDLGHGTGLDDDPLEDPGIPPGHTDDATTGEFPPDYNELASVQNDSTGGFQHPNLKEGDVPSRAEDAPVRWKFMQRQGRLSMRSLENRLGPIVQEDDEVQDHHDLRYKESRGYFHLWPELRLMENGECCDMDSRGCPEITGEDLSQLLCLQDMLRSLGKQLDLTKQDQAFLNLLPKTCHRNINKAVWFCHLVAMRMNLSCILYQNNAVQIPLLHCINVDADVELDWRNGGLTLCARRTLTFSPMTSSEMKIDLKMIYEGYLEIGSDLNGMAVVGQKYCKFPVYIVPVLWIYNFSRDEKRLKKGDPMAVLTMDAGTSPGMRNWLLLPVPPSLFNDFNREEMFASGTGMTSTLVAMLAQHVLKSRADELARNTPKEWRKHNLMAPLWSVDAKDEVAHKLLNESPVQLTNKKLQVLVDTFIHLTSLRKPDLDAENFKMLQKSAFPHIFKRLEEQASCRTSSSNAKARRQEQYLLQNGFLYFEDNKGTLLLVLPPLVLDSLLKSLHDGGLHSISYRLKSSLKSSFHITGWGEAMDNAHKACMTCSLVSAKSRPKAFGSSERSIAAKRPSMAFGFDTMILNIDNKTYYVFVGVCLATNFMVARAIERLSQINMADFLLDVQSILGVSNAVLTDRGGEFNQIFTKTCHSLGLVHFITTPGSSWQAGSVETANRILRKVFKRLLKQTRLTNTLLGVKLVLALSVRVINSMHPYKLPFSRSLLYRGLVPGVAEIGSTQLSQILDDDELLQALGDMMARRDKQLGHLYKRRTGLILAPGSLFLMKGKITGKALRPPEQVCQVVSVLEPRCPKCRYADLQCGFCARQDTRDVSFRNLVTGYEGRTHSALIIPISLVDELRGEYFIPAFFAFHQGRRGAGNTGLNAQHLSDDEHMDPSLQEVEGDPPAGSLPVGLNDLNLADESYLQAVQLNAYHKRDPGLPVVECRAKTNHDNVPITTDNNLHMKPILKPHPYVVNKITSHEDNLLIRPHVKALMVACEVLPSAHPHLYIYKQTVADFQNGNLRSNVSGVVHPRELLPRRRSAARVKWGQALVRSFTLSLDERSDKARLWNIIKSRLYPRRGEESTHMLGLLLNVSSKELACCSNQYKRHLRESYNISS